MSHDGRVLSRISSRTKSKEDVIILHESEQDTSMSIPNSISRGPWR